MRSNGLSVNELFNLMQTLKSAGHGDCEVLIRSIDEITCNVFTDKYTMYILGDNNCLSKIDPESTGEKPNVIVLEY
jgi:hypothetical protein